MRVGNQVFVAGTAAVDEAGNTVGAGDAGTQATYILNKIERALQTAGAQMSDVVRTRIFVTDIADWEGIGRAHGAVFADIRPACTMVEVSRLIAPDLVVEIEADAVIAEGDAVDDASELDLERSAEGVSLA